MGSASLNCCSRVGVGKRKRKRCKLKKKAKLKTYRRIKLHSRNQFITKQTKNNKTNKMSDSVEEKLAKIVGRLDKLDVIACNQERLMNRLTECESRLESIAKKAKEQREAPAPPAPVKK